MREGTRVGTAARIACISASHWAARAADDAAAAAWRFARRARRAARAASETDWGTDGEVAATAENEGAAWAVCKGDEGAERRSKVAREKS